jgi:RNA polymerase sigma factor (TIGR02999 family)
VSVGGPDTNREHADQSPESGVDDLSGLFTILYGELRALASAYFRDQPSNHTLQPTALVHEVFLKLAKSQSLQINSAEHFHAVAARAMRQVLIDEARKRTNRKTMVMLSQYATDQRADSGDSIVDAEALCHAIDALREQSERKAAVVECRLLGGLSIEQTATALNVARSTVVADWSFSRAWLAARLKPESAT